MDIPIDTFCISVDITLIVSCNDPMDIGYDAAYSGLGCGQRRRDVLNRIIPKLKYLMYQQYLSAFHIVHL